VPLPFSEHCNQGIKQPKFSLSCLPRFSGQKKEDLKQQGITDLRQVPDSLLNGTQLKVKQHTIAGTTFFDSNGAAQELSKVTVKGAPHYFLDFETSMTPIPKLIGTRPYQQIPFQFSLHTLQEDDTLEQITFLDLTGNDPRRKFSKKLIQTCGKTGPIFVYNAGFERGIIKNQAERYPELSVDLLAISKRIIDLLPIARNYYYHPSQHGSWSIKAVLPAICPDLNYSDLDGVKDGNMAISAYQEAIDPDTTPERKAKIQSQLDTYCCLDTLAMVRLWEFFSGRDQTASL